MSDTHAARPTDLVALVTFDGEVRENRAVTREALGREPEAPRPLSAALEQWLGLGRQTWVTVQGRSVQGIATARDLSAKSAWIIDTLIDADREDAAGDVLRDLLRQAAVAAERARVTHILLRTPADSPAIEAALRAGFVGALHERVWRGRTFDPAAASDRAGASTSGDPAVAVRPATDADTLALFQLYSRALPIEARQALAMTLDEWQALRERRWCAHGSELVAVANDRVVGALRFGDERAQIELTLEPEAHAAAAGHALLDATCAALDGERGALALVPMTAAASEHVLRERGFAPDGEYVLLSRRVARPVRSAVPARAGVAIPTSG
ncbi:MAG: hypothetical protein O3B31_05540 [Chloroflexi bacterium]|nr:hypothetical protein [Chloroflexota bacterium]